MVDYGRRTPRQGYRNYWHLMALNKDHLKLLMICHPDLFVRLTLPDPRKRFYLYIFRTGQKSRIVKYIVKEIKPRHAHWDLRPRSMVKDGFL